MVTARYSLKLFNEVSALSDDILGARLAKVCIDKGVPVAQVADKLMIAKSTVYSWFRGRTMVPAKHQAKVLAYIAELETS